MIREVECRYGIDPDEILRTATSLDHVSSHVLASSIVAAGRARSLTSRDLTTSAESQAPVSAAGWANMQFLSSVETGTDSIRAISGSGPPDDRPTWTIR